jgi:serine/threonine-protein kinase PRP4
VLRIVFPTDGGRSPSGSPEPDHVFSLAKEEGEKEQAQGQLKADFGRTGTVDDGDDQQQASAADYDPNVDRQQEEARRVWAAKKQDAAMDVDKDGDGEHRVDESTDQELEGEAEEEEDEIEDMFAVNLVPKKKKVKKDAKPLRRSP